MTRDALLTELLTLTPTEWRDVRDRVDGIFAAAELQAMRERAAEAARAWFADRAASDPAGWLVPAGPLVDPAWATVGRDGHVSVTAPRGSRGWASSAEAVSAPGAPPRWRVAGGRVAHRSGHADPRLFRCGVPICADVRVAAADLRDCPACKETP